MERGCTGIVYFLHLNHKVREIPNLARFLVVFMVRNFILDDKNVLFADLINALGTSKILAFGIAVSAKPVDRHAVFLGLDQGGNLVHAPFQKRAVHRQLENAALDPVAIAVERVCDPAAAAIIRNIIAYNIARQTSSFLADGTAHKAAGSLHALQVDRPGPAQYLPLIARRSGQRTARPSAVPRPGRIYVARLASA